ncbi:MAG: ATP-binding cassette domain-containing protein [Kiritimatiellae bacterium]|nr:ATP-binding cassette domain-containing protein [Kiritimatiellia bacterium]
MTPAPTSPAPRLDRVPTAAVPLVVVENASLGYGPHTVLENVNLAIKPGQWLWLIGPNGAGKTTLLRAMVGLCAPLEGVVRRAVHAHPIGYVPQQAWFDHRFPMSAREIAEMGLLARSGPWRHPRPADRALVDQWLRRFDLLDHATKRYAELSGGMRQKLLLARALISGARLFALDEATSELDAVSEATVWSELQHLTAERHGAVIAARHGELPPRSPALDEWIATVKDRTVKIRRRTEAHR